MHEKQIVCVILFLEFMPLFNDAVFVSYTLLFKSEKKKRKGHYYCSKMYAKLKYIWIDHAFFDINSSPDTIELKVFLVIGRLI